MSLRLAEAPIGSDACVMDLFGEQVRRRPEAIAVEFKGQSLTYSELDASANRLARSLRALGVDRETLVGVCVERSLEIVIAVLGVLRAGGAYVPLDPAHGSGRIRSILNDAQVKLLITETSLRESLPSDLPETLWLDEAAFPLIGESASSATHVLPTDLAYVIYTSGSTGKPKGVQIEHRSLSNLLHSMQEEPGFGHSDVLLAVTTLAFDIAGLELYLPLIAGGRVVIAPREATYDGHLLMKLIASSGATVMQATPATWRLLFESGWQGDRGLKVLVGGEALSPELARKLSARCGQVWNMYGPTETTIWSAVYRLEGQEERSVPIGRPVANTALYILQSDGRPVSPGEEGELYIAGDGLARGYLNRPELTGERFLPDPFNFRPGGKMYRTGDLARARQDGNVEYLGRTDFQVKIRGFRVELGEIEAVLEQHPKVLQAVVAARDNHAGEKLLIAYYVPADNQKPTPASLRDHLSAQLPSYMIPSAFVPITKFPLTANCKVDRKALPAPSANDFASGQEYVAPRNPTERKLASLWEEVLEISPIGIKANFFDVGGRSLLAARLFTRISQTFGKDLPLSTLFHSPTVEQLADALLHEAGEPYPTLVAIKPAGSKPPLFCVHGGAGATLFLHQLAQHLHVDQPFYGIEPEGLDGKRFQHLTVEATASHYLSEIRKIQPSGPYLLSGYCFGGLVAFEMAQQLHRQGEQAALLALFSSSLRFNGLLGPQEPAESSNSNFARTLASTIRSMRRRLSLSSRLAMNTYRVVLSLGLRIPPARRTLYIARMLSRAEQAYVPSFYAGEVHLFHGQGLNQPSELMGWDGLANHFENHVIGDEEVGSRRDIMNEPLVGMLAAKLTDCLAKACSAEHFTQALSHGTQ